MPNQGTLVTRAYTSRSQLPISNATVTILKHTEAGKLHLLTVRITDGSGKTAPVVIETPDISEILTPGDPHAFAICDVWAKHPDYQLMEIRNVQIFPGIKSVQEIPMIPLTKRQSAFADAEIVDIPPQDLLGGPLCQQVRQYHISPPMLLYIWGHRILRLNGSRSPSPITSKM